MFGARHWIAGLGVAGLLHAGALALLLDLSPAEAQNPGEEGIVIDLGMLGALGNESADLRASEAAPPPPPEPVVEEVVETPPPPPPPVQKAEVSRKQKPEPKKEKPQKKAVEPPQAQPKTEQPPSAQPASTRSQNQGQDSQNAYRQSSGSANGAAGGGNPNARPSYYSLLAATLARHKRYPASSRRRGEEGVVTLSFTLARSGKVLDFRIAKSSGSRRLDDAVLQMLQQAQPLPPFPDEISEQTLSIRLPIAFSLKERR